MRVKREKENKKIVALLGNGVVYKGVWQSNSEYFIFEDAEVTKGSFLARNLKEAKRELIELRKKFNAKPPVF